MDPTLLDEFAPAKRSNGAESTRDRQGISTFIQAIIVFLAVSGIPFPASATEARSDIVKLVRDLGNHHYPVTTAVRPAQDYFDQGLILSYGFNHAEAARSFREAARQDPDCAMAYWGEALVLGPNINAPMDKSAIPAAYSAIQKALSLSNQKNAKEFALIHALSVRYSKDPVNDRSGLDVAYADAMRAVTKQFPHDPVIGALFAESLMDLHPWDYWNKQGEARPWTPEILSVLEQVLEIDRNHPLANHLYIHAVEASPHPEKALPNARRLPGLVPGSGHLVHMPAHIYLRVGLYREAVAANQTAVHVDHQYLSHSHAEGVYTMAYVPHNFHFLWAAAVKSGQSTLAAEAARDTRAQVDPERIRDPGFTGTLQHFWLIPLYTQALFGRWDEILRQPEPAQDLLYARAVRHYARGLALIRHGQATAADQEFAQLQEIIRDPGIEGLTIFDLNPIRRILEIAEASLAGEIAAGRRDYQAAVAQLQKAVEIEDALNYTEPRDWYLPSRQALGAILLDAGNSAMAEDVFREDLKMHPKSGWSLFGLLQSLKAQGKDAQAREIETAYNEAWRDADIELKSSRF